MARKLIGTAVTDENGEATITYTGTGAGKLNVVAESGTFVSETIEVVDCQFYDCAIDSPCRNTYWVNQAGSLDVTPTNDGTTLTKGTGQSSGELTPSTLSNQTDWTKKKTFDTPVCVEYTIVEKGTNVMWRFYNSANGSMWYQGTHNATGHYKFIIDSTNKVKLEIDGQQQSLSSLPSSLPSKIDFSFTFGSVSSGSFTFKDFRVYPI